MGKFFSEYAKFCGQEYVSAWSCGKKFSPNWIWNTMVAVDQPLYKCDHFSQFGRIYNLGGGRIFFFWNYSQSFYLCEYKLKPVGYWKTSWKLLKNTSNYINGFSQHSILYISLTDTYFSLAWLCGRHIHITVSQKYEHGFSPFPY